MRRSNQSGIALILVLLIIVILYVVTTQVVYTSRVEEFSARNVALLARMDLAMDRALETALQALIDDAAAAGGGGEAAGGAGAPGAGGMPGLPTGGGAPGAQGGGEESVFDSRNDPWVKPECFTDEEITVHVHVVDENRKFNLLSLLSPDQEFARLSQERLVRLLDTLREDSDFDLNRGDAELIVNSIKDYMEGRTRPEEFGRPEQLSDKEGSTVKIPRSLDELLVLREIDATLLYDQIRGERFYPGLASVLTVWTSQHFPTLEEPEGTRGRVVAVPGATGAPAPQGGAEQSASPLGVGIAINVNTAPRAVLRSLLSEYELPNQVLAALLAFRNEEQEDAPPAAEEEPTLEDELVGSTRVLTKEFKSLADLDQVEEFKNWGIGQERDSFLKMLGVESDVFTIHLAATVRINEEKNVVFVRRSRIVVRRESGGEGGAPGIVVILPREDRGEELVIDYPDFPDLERERQEALQFTGEYSDFAAEELYWNPFRFEFYVRDLERLSWRPGS